MNERMMYDETACQCIVVNLVPVEELQQRLHQ
jgi:hypothetical protein